MLTYKELLERTDAPPGSAWGLFGDDDELGTINFLTASQAIAASRCVRNGSVFNLDLPLDAFDPPLFATRRLHKHTIFQRNSFHRDDYVDGLYMQVSSQIDGLRHMANPDHGFYNGVSPERFVPGDTALSISRWTDHGIVGRGVLVDVARYLSGKQTPLDHRSGQPVPVEVVEAAAEEQGVRFEPGDILLLRFGFLRYYFEEISEVQRRHMPDRLHNAGLLQAHETLAWLWDHQFSLVAADNFSLECWPADASSPFISNAERASGTRDVHTGFMHRYMIPLLGLAVGELWALEALADACARDGINECMVVASPLNLVGGVGSPANAVAIR